MSSKGLKRIDKNQILTVVSQPKAVTMAQQV